MGHIVSKVTDAIGLTDSKAGQRSADAATKASGQQLAYQQEALDYLKQDNALPSSVRDQALTALSGVVDQGPGTDVLYNRAQSSPLYDALLSGSDEATLRNASATGGIRGGAAISDLATAQNNALLQSYQNEVNQQNAQTSLLSGLAGINTGSGQIANLTQNMGATAAQGTTAAAQAINAGNQQNIGNLMNTVSTGGSLFSVLASAGMFSDVRLKRDIELIGEQSGYPVYQWTWNDEANKLGLTGRAFGTLSYIVKEKCPEAVTVKDGYEQVNYKAIGVDHGATE